MEETYGRGGGILADDMGLGKTLQSLALIVNSMHEGTTLIVMPLSLLHQWRREIEEKINLPLKVEVYHGSKRNNNIKPREFDIVLTTYGCVMEEFKKKTKGKKSIMMEYKWLRIILDECQWIKNQRTKTAEAVMKLKARFRWCLSGTPIQNYQTELSGLFQFIQQSSNVLQLMPNWDYLRGYILRRTKEQVLDLPEKKIIKEIVKFSKHEKNHYRDVPDWVETQLPNIRSDKAYYLLLCLRLRQCADDPQICNPDWRTGQSSKQAEIIEILQDIKRENSTTKTVLFSTFVPMLKEMAEIFKKHEWEYELFDGSLKMDERDKALKRFEHDKNCNLLLMSTKAGNVGLNLTCATRVILIEPWWNPFVENQAMDRVHRIGQREPVTIYRIIMKRSIEEGILHIQEQKKKMFKDTFGGIGGCPVKLTLKDMQYMCSS